MSRFSATQLLGSTRPAEWVSSAYLAVLGAAVFCYAALGAVLSILPRYVPERLGGGATAIGVAVGAPALTGLLARPVGGRIADRAGPLPPLLGGAALMAAGAVPAAAFPTLGALLSSRLVVGAGEGLMMGSAVLWLLRLAGIERRGRALGHIGLANYAGLALGPLLATSLGGASMSQAVLWVAVPLPLLGAATAVVARRTAQAASQPTAETGEATPGAHRGAADAHRAAAGEERTSTRTLLRLTAPAGLGLLLVNVGYVSVLSFGGATAKSSGTDLRTAIVPIFAAVVIISRTAGGGIPDRLGGRATVTLFAGAESLGLLAFANASGPTLELASLLALSVGQSLAVPGLGLLALSGVPPTSQGAAVGLFFAWFDAGVGLGGPVVGSVAAATGPAGGLEAAAAAVAGAVVIARLVRRDHPLSQTHAQRERVIGRGTTGCTRSP